MNIFIDGTISSYPKGGIGQYFQNIASNLVKGNNIYFSSKKHFRREQLTNNQIKAPILPHFRPHRLSYFMDYLFYRVSHKKMDIVHLSNYSLNYTGNYYHKKGAKLAVTVYDMIHELDEKEGHLYIPSSKKWTIENADVIFCISEHTKRDLDRFYHVNPDKVFVTHLAAKDATSPINKAPNPYTSPYLLHVGNREGYKNFSIIPPALKKILEKWPNLTLKVTGSEFTQEEETLINKSGVSDSIENLGFVDEQNLSLLYSNSIALLYPSLYEGFGLPILEAMKHRTIPIFFDTSSLPEIAGDAGIKISVHNIDDLSDSVLHLQDRRYRDKLLDLGTLQASNFSWDKTGNETLAGYHFALKESETNSKLQNARIK